MVDLPLPELISLAEAVGIIATLFVIFYYSRKGVRSILVDIETKVLNDLDEKIHGMAEMLVRKPDLVKLLDRDATTQSPDEVVFAFYILYMCAYAFHMRQRNVLSDNEWAGWLRWMRSAFELGTLGEYWKTNVNPERWFDPAFQEFIDTEIMRRNAA